MGILELPGSRLANDVVSRLAGVPVEFVSFSAEKVPLERGYRVVLDRLSFQYVFLREVVKSLAVSGTYVINNPFAAASTNKLVEIELGRRLGLVFPRTVVLPDRLSLEETEGIVTEPELERVADEVGLPCVLKPFDGYAWEDVYVVNSIGELRETYRSLRSRRVLVAQQLIRFREYFRAFCFDKRDVLFVKWIPKPLGMGQYLGCDAEGVGSAKGELNDLTIRLNQALDLDVNVVEWCVDGEGRWWVIDAFNEVPDVVPEALPLDCYSWVVDRFAACVMDKLRQDQRNCIPFALAAHERVG